MSAWFLIAVAGWFVAIFGLWLQSRWLAQARRGTLSADTPGWCIARGDISAVPVGIAPPAGRTNHALFGALAPDRLWFIRQHIGGGVRVFGPPLGSLQLSGTSAHYEVRVGVGAIAWVVGSGVFLLSAIVLATGGGAWVVAGTGVLLSAVALHVRSERRNAAVVAAEILRALPHAG
ncbi:MAG: hypothetical protein JNL48_20215 [Acidobacteria bacterium]|nr:hypothetical protein [Acidobacteriota bacterium]